MREGEEMAKGLGSCDGGRREGKGCGADGQTACFARLRS